LGPPYPMLVNQWKSNPSNIMPRDSLGRHRSDRLQSRAASCEPVGDFVSSYPSMARDPIQPHRMAGRDIIQCLLGLLNQWKHSTGPKSFQSHLNLTFSRLFFNAVASGLKSNVHHTHCCLNSHTYAVGVGQMLAFWSHSSPVLLFLALLVFCDSHFCLALLRNSLYLCNIYLCTKQKCQCFVQGVALLLYLLVWQWQYVIAETYRNK